MELLYMLHNAWMLGEAPKQHAFPLESYEVRATNLFAQEKHTCLHYYTSAWPFL